MKKNNRSGFTLLEVVIASIILIAMLYVIFRILMSTTAHTVEAQVTSDLELRGRKFIMEYENEYNFARINAVEDNGHSWVQVQIPVDWDGDGDIIDQFGGVEFGAIDPNGLPQLGYSMFFRYQPELVIREQNGPSLGLPGTTEEQVTFDLNKDGDLNDSLVQGQVVKEIRDDAGGLVDSTVFSAQVILAPNLGSGGLDGDVDGDGENDLLFDVIDDQQATLPSASIKASGAAIRITVYHGNYGNLRKTFHLRTNSRIMHFRNPQ